MSDNTKLILVVDDDPHHLNIIREGLTLSPNNYQVIEAASLEEAGKLVSTTDPDLAIFDVFLPDGNAVEYLAREISKYKFPVIILTGKPDEKLAVEATKIGVLDYLVKTKDAIENLDKHIERTLREWNLVLERNRAEQERLELYNEREELERIINQSQTVVFLWKPDMGRPVEFVSESVSQLGYTPKDFISGRVPYFSIVHLDDLDRVLETIDGYIENPADNFYNIEYRILTPAGDVRWLDDRTWLIRKENGEITRLQGTILDITDRRKSEEHQKILELQLLEGEKMRSIGQLAAGIAHEINTPAQYVSDNTRFLQDCFNGVTQVISKYKGLLDAAKSGEINPIEPSMIADIEKLIKDTNLDYLTEEIPSAINDTIEGIDRISEIVKAMKAFSHPGVEKKTNIDINSAIANTISISKHEWKYVADVVTDLDRNLPHVMGFPGELNQALLNLVTNAAHAIGDVLGENPSEKGRISITTKYNDQYAEIRITDTGTGIPEDIRSRIFDHFFTTKPIGKGTGQGLTIAYDVVVNKHGGKLLVESEVGVGTTFIIQLPLHTEKIEAIV